MFHYMKCRNHITKDRLAALSTIFFRTPNALFLHKQWMFFGTNVCGDAMLTSPL